MHDSATSTYLCFLKSKMSSQVQTCFDSVCTELRKLQKLARLQNLSRTLRLNLVPTVSKYIKILWSRSLGAKSNKVFKKILTSIRPTSSLDYFSDHENWVPVAILLLCACGLAFAQAPESSVHSPQLDHFKWWDGKQVKSAPILCSPASTTPANLFRSPAKQGQIH